MTIFDILRHTIQQISFCSSNQIIQLTSAPSSYFSFKRQPVPNFQLHFQIHTSKRQRKRIKTAAVDETWTHWTRSCMMFKGSWFKISTMFYKEAQSYQVSQQHREQYFELFPMQFSFFQSWIRKLRTWNIIPLNTTSLQEPWTQPPGWLLEPVHRFCYLFSSFGTSFCYKFVPRFRALPIFCKHFKTPMLIFCNKKILSIWSSNYRTIERRHWRQPEANTELWISTKKVLPYNSNLVSERKLP